MTDFTGSNTPAEHRDSWRTPPEIFAALNAEFVFQLDAAASEKTDYVGFLSHRSRTHKPLHGLKQWDMPLVMSG